MAAAPPTPSLPPFERVAHRGAKRELPENTLVAFARALDRGADSLELDVHVTADGVVVIHHDPTLGPAAGDLAGRRIDSLSWRELRRVELAAGVGIPSLAELLDAVGGRASVYVELKGEGIERAVIEAVRRSATRCALHSFDHAAVARAAHLAPEIPRGVLFEHSSRGAAAALEATGATTLWPHWPLVTPELLAMAAAHGARTIAWTVNSRTTAARLVGMGVAGICSDDLRLFDPAGDAARPG